MRDVLRSPSVTNKMETLLSRLPKLDTPPIELSNTWFDEIDAISSIHPASILFALHRAREARELAVSYRDFNVGAAALAIAFSSTRFQFLTGVNIKPDEQSSLNLHAEQSTLRKATDENTDRISLLAVVGNTQNDQQSGHPMHTLHPCGLCRSALRRSDLIDPESTLIVSALPDLRTIEAYNLNQLDAYHEDPDSTKLTRFELDDMEIFKPVVEPDDKLTPTRQIDSPGAQAEKDEWFNTMGVFSILWMQHHLSRLKIPPN